MDKVTNKYVPPHKRNNGEIQESRQRLEFNMKQNNTTSSLLEDKLRVTHGSYMFNDEEPRREEYKIEIPTVVNPIMIRKSYDLPKRELRLITDLEETRKRNKEREFRKWADHYKEELDNMYKKYVDPKLNIYYEDFVETAYICTESTYNKKLFKRTKPLE